MAITEGEGGAELIVGRKKLKQAAVKVETVEETGAGDGFGCGLVAGLIKFTSLEKALKLGSHKLAIKTRIVKR